MTENNKTEKQESTVDEHKEIKRNQYLANFVEIAERLRQELEKAKVGRGKRE